MPKGIGYKGKKRKKLTNNALNRAGAKAFGLGGAGAAAQAKVRRDERRKKRKNRLGINP